MIKVSEMYEMIRVLRRPLLQTPNQQPLVQLLKNQRFLIFTFSTQLTHFLPLLCQYLQGGFFNWSALKMTKCQITCKSLQKSSKCQIFLRVWHLVIFRADQLKKPPCIFLTNLIRNYFFVSFQLYVNVYLKFCFSETG